MATSSENFGKDIMGKASGTFKERDSPPCLHLHRIQSCIGSPGVKSANLQSCLEDAKSYRKEQYQAGE
jgi:hypothetical protein